MNGHAVGEAEDVKASYVRGLAPGSVASGGLTMMDAAQIQTPDKNTVVIKLKYPFANFKNILASGQYSSISRARLPLVSTRRRRRSVAALYLG